MTETLATAAYLLVPFLAIVLVGAVAVAVHDGLAAWWGARRPAPAARPTSPRRAPVRVAVRLEARRPTWRRAPVVRPAFADGRPLVGDR